MLNCIAAKPDARKILFQLRTGGEVVMTEQDKREKVIKALECCMSGQPDGLGCSRVPCPYNLFEDCEGILHSDALALLKAEKPRVMTLEEAKSIEGYAWLECRDRDVLSVSFFRSGFYIEPFERPLRADLMNWADYNKGWRYWTSCPTDAQREKVKWDG